MFKFPQRENHLGAALGTEAFVHEFVSKKVQQWVEEVLHLSSIASTQPHAAFSAFIWGLFSKWTYISRTIPNIEELFESLEDTIRSHFIPALTGMAAPSDIERNLFALPCRLGGIGSYKHPSFPLCKLTASNCSGFNYGSCRSIYVVDHTKQPQ